MGLPEQRPGVGRRVAAVVLVVYLALLFYALGAGLLESLLNYPMWRDMGAGMSNADFTATRRDHLGLIFPLLVIPVALRFPPTVFLLVRRPAFVPRWAVLVAFACQVVGWLSSFAIQIPIQTALTDHGYSDALFARLIVTDFWLRVLPSVLEAAVGVFLLWRVAARLA
ncbi:MAG: hypothetical protein K2X82_32670 [Gemmataceae bacterium]|nr:hypothetical protein [Gemmataceae bacterium]